MAGSNDLVITAGLNVPATTNNIKSELEQQVAPQLNGVLKINCAINTNNIQALQQQLNNISSGLKINVSNISADVGNTKINTSLIKQIEEKLSLDMSGKNIKGLNLDGLINEGRITEIRQEMIKLLTEYQKFYQMGQDSKAFDFMPKIIDYFKFFYKEINFANQELLNSQEQVKAFARESQTAFDSKSWKDLEIMLEKAGRKSLLSSVFGVGNFKEGSGTRDIAGFIEDFNAKNFGIKLPSNDAVAAVQQLYDFLSKDFNNALYNSTQAEQAYNAQVEKTIEVVNNALGVTQRYNDEKALRSGEFVEIIGIEELDSAINKTTNSMNNLAEAERVVVSNSALIKQAPQGFEDTSNVIKEAEKAFSDLDGVLKATATDITQPDGQITRFTVNVTDTTNAVRAFTYALKETENGLTAFELVGSRGNDAGIEKQMQNNIKAADEYASKLASLKNNASGFDISATINGTNITLKDFEKSIEDLRNGTKSVEAVRSEFSALDSELKSLTTLARESQGKSFNPLTNAAISAQELDNTLKTIKADMDSLSSASKGNLSATYQDLEKSYQNLQSQPEKTREWLEQYSLLAATIRTVQGEIKLAKKLEREDSSSAVQKTLQYLSQVKQAYADIATNSKALNKSGLTADQKSFYSANKEEANKRLQSAIQLLSEEKLITAEVQEQLNNYKNQDTILQQSLQLEREKVSAQQKNRADLKDISAQSTINKLNSDLDKLTDKINKLNDSSSDKTGLTAQIDKIRDSVKKLNDIDISSDKGLISWNGKLMDIRNNMNALTQDITKATNAEKQIEQVANKANSSINQYISTLSKFNNSAIARNNSSNTNVQSQTAINTGLISQLQELQNSLKLDNSAENINRVKTALDTLVPSLDSAVTSSKSLDNALKNNNDLAAREARLKSLQNQIEIFAKANATAVNSTNVMKSGTTFADEFKRIQDLANSKNLDNNAIRRLTEDFRNFKSEAKSVGMTTNKFFTDMGSQLKMVITRWVSLYAIIGKIRTMINYVIQLDTAMINLQRVTTATAEEYEKFLENAAKTAQNTNTQLSDVVEQSARWAKAGFGLDELSDVSDASLVYSIVGDIDNETAVSDLVTALKGFRLEANQTMSIVDKLDILNNKYATDAKSLGEALSVSASAMAESGNTLDQTLALITGGSEITQNAKEMGNALKVMSMRIRGMKGKLEELGEESEGIESISKVQTQILNLTKGAVNIFDDDGKFRGTYEILEDISKVIDKLSDPDRANLTEILFGKLRGNQGLAVLSAFQSGQIGKALEDAQNSAGTALEEMGRYSTSVNAHITNLKSSVQELSNTMFSSDFLKFWVDFGKGAVNALTTTGEFLDKNTAWLGENEKGILGVKTALASLIGIIASFKGTNYMKSIQGLFKPSAISGISKDDVAALRNYNALIAQGVPMEQAHAQALNQASVGAQRLATSANGAAVSENLLAAAENKVTFATKALTVATNAFWNIGITLLISTVIGAISKLVDKLIVTREENEEMVNSISQNMQALSDSHKQLVDSGEELDNLLSQYTQIVSATDDMSTVKTELQGIQDSLIEKFGEEAESIDLLNGKYSDTIQKIKELSQAEYEEWKRQNTDKIKEAERYQNAYIDSSLFNARRDSQGNVTDANNYFFTGKNDISDDVLSLYTLKDVNKILAETANSLPGIFRTTRGFTKDTIMLSGSLEDAERQLEYLIDAYSSYDDYDSKQLAMLQERYNKIHEINQDSKEMLQEVESRNTQDLYNKTWEQLGNEEKFNNLIDKAVELNRVIQGEGTYTERYAATEELKELETELYQVAGKSENYQDIIKNTFDSFKEGANVAIESTDDLRSKWFESLEETQKESLKNIDSMKAALQTLASGGKLSSDDFWNLQKLDTDGILSGVKLIGDEFVVNQQSLINMKDTYIKKTVEQLKADNQILENKRKELNLEKAIDDAQIIIAKGINSSGDVQLLENQKSIVEEVRRNIKAYGDEIKRNDLLIKMFNNSLGNTVDLSEALKKNLEKQVKSVENQIKGIENQVKAEQNNLKEQEKAIDAEIKSLENEKKAHEEIKAELEEQLAYLEEQQKELENIIKNYESVADVVKEYADSEIDSLKEQQEEIKNSYDEQINSLKELHDKKEEENELVEKQIDLQNKLKAVEDARRNKNVKTYSSAQGWHYAASKEDVTNAESEAKEAEKTLNDFLAEQEYNQRIETLEKERDAAIASYEAEIKAYENYVKEWENILKAETKAENERLANEILGYEWREKIKKKDTALLQTFGGEFQNYNRQLDNLVDNEITSLKDSIKAKENEIGEIDKMIQKQNEYKSELQDASNAITDSLQEQIDALNEHKTALESALNEAENAWDGYTNNLRKNANQQADALWDMRTAYREAMEDIAQMKVQTALDEYFDDDSSIGKIIGHIWGIPGYSSGGAVTNTGIAMLHGKKNSAETIFNAAQSRELYDMVKSGDFANLVANKAIQGIGKGIRNQNIANRSISGDIVFNIEKIVTDSPTDFMNQLNGYMNGFMKNYWKTKLTESYTQN